MTPQEATALQNRVAYLEQLVLQHMKGDRFHFHRPITSGPDGLRIQLDALGKLAFYGETPITRPSSSGEISGTASGTGTALKHDDLHYGGAITATNVTGYTINDIVKHLKNLGALTR